MPVPPHANRVCLDGDRLHRLVADPRAAVLPPLGRGRRARAATSLRPAACRSLVRGLARRVVDGERRAALGRVAAASAAGTTMRLAAGSALVDDLKRMLRRPEEFSFSVSDVVRMVTVPLPGSVVGRSCSSWSSSWCRPGCCAGSAGSLPGVELVAVEEAVLVAVDADARAVARRHAGVGQLLPGGRRERAHLGVGEQRPRWRGRSGTGRTPAAPRRAARRAMVPFTTTSHSPAAARAIRRSMRGPTVARVARW